METTNGATRRAVLTGAGAAAALAGCAGCTRRGATAAGGPPPGTARPATPGAGSSAGSPAGSSAGSSAASAVAGPEIRVADIPVRGGAIYPDADADGVVITQPTAGVFRAFSATCTHRGCLLASVSDGTINCPCHGARFAITDGSVVRAGDGIPTPTTALPPKRVTVSGDRLILS